LTRDDKKPLTENKLTNADNTNQGPSRPSNISSKNLQGPNTYQPASNINGDLPSINMMNNQQPSQRSTVGQPKSGSFIANNPTSNRSYQNNEQPYENRNQYPKAAAPYGNKIQFPQRPNQRSRNKD
jgi:hypothetical protein